MNDDIERKCDDETEMPDSVGIKRARSILGDLVSRAKYGNERIVLLRRGNRDAAIVSMKDLERLKQLDAAVA